MRDFHFFGSKLLKQERVVRNGPQQSCRTETTKEKCKKEGKCDISNTSIPSRPNRPLDVTKDETLVERFQSDYPLASTEGM